MVQIPIIHLEINTSCPGALDTLYMIPKTNEPVAISKLFKTQKYYLTQLFGNIKKKYCCVFSIVVLLYILSFI